MILYEMSICLNVFSCGGGKENDADGGVVTEVDGVVEENGTEWW